MIGASTSREFEEFEESLLSAMFEVDVRVEGAYITFLRFTE